MCNKCFNLLNRHCVLRIDDYSQDKEKYFDDHIYFFVYDGLIRKLILQYKFGDKSYIYRTFSNFIKKYKKICLFLKKYDIIIPVPISKKRLKSRGYNQSALIARNLAEGLQIEYNDKILIKNKEVKPQSSLNKEERIKNVQDVYIIQNGEKIINKRILLIDDIYTTGSTVNECSRILKEYKTKEIGILTLAKD
ncbi:MAG: ComF family protein [Clostridia bacterium]|nr:ComF family protein [Clostridia bacterium]